MGQETSKSQQQDFLQGQLLVAMPNLREGCFQESVVIMCSHDEDHAMGLIVNKAIQEFDFEQLLEQLDMEAGPSAAEKSVYFGGPVDTKRGLVLHSLDYRSDETLEVTSEIGLTATRQILLALSDGGSDVANVRAPEHALLCMGHAGWAPGQLESELARNTWLNIEARPDLVFADKPEHTWQSALTGIGISQSMFSAEWADARPPDAPLN